MPDRIRKDGRIYRLQHYDARLKRWITVSVHATKRKAEYAKRFRSGWKP